jgi:hypothetical protein
VGSNPTPPAKGHAFAQVNATAGDEPTQHYAATNVASRSPGRVVWRCLASARRAEGDDEADVCSGCTSPLRRTRHREGVGDDAAHPQRHRGPFRLSEEELTRGVRKGKDGRFRNAPKVVPKAVHNELVTRRMSKAYDLLRESTYDAVRVLVEVAKDENADTAVRVKAAELILDRTLGKAPQHVTLDVNAPWQKLMAQAIVGSVDAPDGEGRG